MEEHFKNKLKNHKVDWDKTILLDSMQGKLVQKGKKGIDWKWALLLLPVFLFLTCWGLKQPNSTESQADSVQEVNYSNQKKSENISAKNQSINQHKTSNIQEEIPIVEINNIEDKTRKSNNVAIERTVLRDNRDVKQSFNVPEIQSNYSPPLLPSNTKSLLELGTQLTKNAATEHDHQEVANHEVFRDENTSEIQEDSDVKQNNHTILYNIESKPLLLASIPLITFSHSNFLIGKDDSLSLSYVENIQSENKFTTKNPFYISAFSGIGLVNRDKKYITDNSEYLERLVANEETETTLFSIHANLNIGYQHASGLLIESGLEYNRIQEVFNYNRETELGISSKERLLYFVVQQNSTDTIFVKDTVDVLTVEERMVRHYNNHTYFTIPLQVGYEFDCKKLRLRTNLGLSYTIKYNYIGKRNFVFENFDSIISENNEELQFTLKNKIGFQAGLSLEYPIMKSSRIFANLSYRQGPLLNIGVTDQKYHTLSIGVGFRVLLANGL